MRTGCNFPPSTTCDEIKTILLRKFPRVEEHLIGLVLPRKDLKEDLVLEGKNPIGSYENFISEDTILLLHAIERNPRMMTLSLKRKKKGQNEQDAPPLVEFLRDPNCSIAIEKFTPKIRSETYKVTFSFKRISPNLTQPVDKSGEILSCGKSLYKIVSCLNNSAGAHMKKTWKSRWLILQGQLLYLSEHKFKDKVSNFFFCWRSVEIIVNLGVSSRF